MRDLVAPHYPLPTWEREKPRCLSSTFSLDANQYIISTSCNSWFTPRPNQRIYSPVPSHERGVTRRHERGTECGGRERVGRVVLLANGSGSRTGLTPPAMASAQDDRRAIADG